MFETEQIVLNNLQIEELAEKMSVQTKKISTIQHKDAWKILLVLYRETVINLKEEKWIGIQATPLGDLCKIKSNIPRHLKSLNSLGLIRSQTDISSYSTREKFYSLTDEGRELIEEVMQRTKGFISFIRPEIVAGELTQISGNLDTYNIIIGSLAYLYNYPEDLDEPPNLYALSQTLDMKPSEVMEVLKEYSLFGDEKPRKDSTPLFRIYPSHPRLKHYAFNCNDWVVCNYLCKLCHDNVIELTSYGENMCKSLSKNPQKMNYKIRQASIDKFLIITLMIGFLILSIAYVINSTLDSVTLYLLMFLFITNGITYWIIRNKNNQLVFEKEES